MIGRVFSKQQVLAEKQNERLVTAYAFLLLLDENSNKGVLSDQTSSNANKLKLLTGILFNKLETWHFDE